jgi:hypothetical protein
MWLLFHRILSRSCICLAVAWVKLFFGIKASSDGILGFWRFGFARVEPMRRHAYG